MCMPVCDGAARHGIIDLDLSTVEMKAISEAFLTHTLVGLSNTLLCRSLPPGSVLRPAVASAQDALEPQALCTIDRGSDERLRRILRTFSDIDIPNLVFFVEIATYSIYYRMTIDRYKCGTLDS